MAHLPVEHKQLIQTTYVRHREIGKELPGVDRKVQIGQIAFWGGLAGVLVGVARIFTDYYPFPPILWWIAVAGFLFGWACKAVAKKEQAALWEEQAAMRRRMREIDVWFSDDREHTTVYVGDITSENSVSPMFDGAYQ